ncbi:MAG TPA: type II toxin-antitoxin system VapC family toxin [Nitrososphaerales archaeon]|nr:type II toxin-antitoxin system VapC family toxin [Nitrososphaerales archaeon]
MTVIIDASSLTAFLLEEENDDQENIRKLLIQRVCATELVITESCNAILTAIRRRPINEEQAEKALEVLLSFIDTNIKIFKESESLLNEA